jgi:hypothetical protein
MTHSTLNFYEIVRDPRNSGNARNWTNSVSVVIYWMLRQSDTRVSLHNEHNGWNTDNRRNDYVRRILRFCLPIAPYLLSVTGRHIPERHLTAGEHGRRYACCFSLYDVRSNKNMKGRSFEWGYIIVSGIGPVKFINSSLYGKNIELEVFSMAADHSTKGIIHSYLHKET